MSSKSLFRFLNVFLITLLIFSFSSLDYAQSSKWVGTWSTAPQLVETNNNPPSPGLSNNTLRQIVHVSIGGDSLRMRFTNEFSTNPVTMHSVHIASSLGSDTIDTATDIPLYFSGDTSVTMQAGSAVMSDPFYFPLQPLSNVTITIYFGSTSSDITGHPGSRTTSYILTGDNVSNENFSGAVTTDHWYIINTIEVKAPDSAYAVAVLGNSITDGRGSGTNKQNRWPDELSRRFQDYPGTQMFAVLNEGIGGNAVLNGGLGPTALSRFQRDILDQNGVKWLIILEGINDIGGGASGDNLINAFTQMTNAAHSNGIFVYGATLLPMKGSSYYTTQHEAQREIVNEWIRTSNLLDGVIDLDMAVRNPADTLSLLPIYDSGDHLHPSEAGHHQMAEAVDLSLFNSEDTLVYVDNSQTIYFEPECATVGTDWNILNDPQASNGKYVTVKSGVESLNSAPTDSSGYIIIPFSVDSAGSFSVFARLNDPTYNDDSYWVKMDGGTFTMDNGLVTSGWQWLKFNDYTLTAGDHILTIAYREDGAELDKICITNSGIAPTGMGKDAENLCSTIPVELISFSANTAGNKIELLWSTATETNNAGFEIQRSIDNKEFVTIGYVKGKGTTTEKQSYTYVDNVSGGKFYYRLKQVDFSGSYEYSNVVEVTSVPLKFNLSQNYPNPFNPSTKISYSLPKESYVTLKVYDVLGKEVATLVNEKESAGNYEIDFDASGFSSGIYYYKLVAGNFSQVKKMILIK